LSVTERGQPMSAEDYRRIAQQYLIRAYRLSDLVAKTMMLDLAEHWLRLAAKAERTEMDVEESSPGA
jgi:hypothetical protein